MRNEINCCKCKFFVQYYIIYKAKLKEAGTGYCSHHYLMPHERKKFPFVSDCPSYEEPEAEKKDICYDVAKILSDIRKQCSDILMILGLKG